VQAPANPSETADPARREPWQTRDELKFLFWIAVGVGFVALVAVAALLVRN
jgi:hypothetical protein